MIIAPIVGAIFASLLHYVFSKDIGTQHEEMDDMGGDTRRRSSDSQRSSDIETLEDVAEERSTSYPELEPGPELRV